MFYEVAKLGAQPPLGYLVAGGLAQRLGAPNAILIAGGAVFVIAAVLALRFRALQQLR